MGPRACETPPRKRATTPLALTRQAKKAQGDNEKNIKSPGDKRIAGQLRPSADYDQQPRLTNDAYASSCDPEIPPQSGHCPLLDLPDEIKLQVVRCLTQEAAGRVLCVHKSLFNIVKPHLYSDVALVLSRSQPCQSQEDCDAVLDSIECHTVNLKLVVKDDRTGNELFQWMAPALADMRLLSLVFNDMAEKTKDRHIRMRSALNSVSWSDLGKALKGTHLGSTLRHIKFPEYVSEEVMTTEDGYDPVNALNLLDSDIAVEFIATKLSRGSIIKVEARGSQETMLRPANGSPLHLVKRFIRMEGVSGQLISLTLTGTSAYKQQPPFKRYRNPLSSLDLVKQSRRIDVVRLSLDNFYCASIPLKLYCSINISSIRRLSISRCYETHLVFRRLMESKQPLKIEHLKIQNYNGDDDMGYEEAPDYSFDALVATFDTLETVEIRAALPCEMEMKIFGAHLSLRSCIIDHGMSFTAENLYSLAKNNKRIQLLGYRDENISLPLEIGKLHQDFLTAFTPMATALMEFPALSTLKLIFSPVVIGKIRFAKARKGEAAEELLANTLHELLIEYAKKDKKECKITTIILSVQPVDIPRNKYGFFTVPEDMVYRFKD